MISIFFLLASTGADDAWLAQLRRACASTPVRCGANTSFFGTTIGGQYLLYDFWTRLFRVSPDDLNLVLDVFADRISFYGT